MAGGVRTYALPRKDTVRDGRRVRVPALRNRDKGEDLNGRTADGGGSLLPDSQYSWETQKGRLFVSVSGPLSPRAPYYPSRPGYHVGSGTRDALMLLRKSLYGNDFLFGYSLS